MIRKTKTTSIRFERELTDNALHMHACRCSLRSLYFASRALLNSSYSKRITNKSHLLKSVKSRFVNEFRSQKSPNLSVSELVFRVPKK